MSWDIFCSVVDNFGDIGVSWRLARQLASEQGARVRLWVDNLHSFQALCPELDVLAPVQTLHGIEIRHWTPEFAAVEPGDVVLEAFGCRLPEAFVAAMALRAPPPVWINLEYLSAEDWVESHHGLASPHPRLPLVKYFFFPGFTARSGGLPVERDFAPRRDAFQADATAIAAFRVAIGAAPAEPGVLNASLFCYAHAPLAELLETLGKGAIGVDCLVPAGAGLERIRSITGAALRPGEAWRRGRLRLQAVPFLDQDGYDRLLWASDLNFVRGEDSFVRAQLAARPMVWQPYRQEEGSHLVKMQAFLGRYCLGMDAAQAASVRGFWDAWNGPSAGGDAWAGLWASVLAVRPAWGDSARAWAGVLGGAPTLADNLALFCQNKLK